MNDRTAYVIDTPLNDQIEMVAHLKWAGVLVPASVDDLKAALLERLDDLDLEAARKELDLVYALLRRPAVLHPDDYRQMMDLFTRQIVEAALGETDES